MAELFAGDPIEFQALEERGTAEVVGNGGFATGFSEGLANNFTAGIAKAPTYLAGGLGFSLTAEPTLDVGVANEKYSVPGRLTFDKPIPESVARDLYEHHRANIQREDAVARSEGGVLQGAARFTGNIAAGFLDPVGLAVGFVPVLGQARYARLLAGAASAGGRAGVRAGIGAAQGAITTAALQPLEFGINLLEQDDFTMADALLNTAMGGLFGAAIPTAAGAIGDRITGRYSTPIGRIAGDAGPEANETLLRGALAQTIDDRPVDVAQTLEAFHAERTAKELGVWSRRQAALEKDADDALKGVESTEFRGEAGARTRGVVSERLTALREEAETLQSEIAARRQEAAEAIDPVTRERLAVIEEDLDKPGLSAKRRAELDAEHRLLTEGSGVDEGLVKARAEAEAAGLSRELGRVRQRIGLASGRLVQAEGRAGSLRAVSEARFARQSQRIEQQQALLRQLTDRTLRRIAGRAGVVLSREETGTLAQRVLSREITPEAVLAEILQIRSTKKNSLSELAESFKPLPDDILELEQQYRDMVRELTRKMTETARKPPAVNRASADEAAVQRQDVDVLRQQVEELETQLGKDESVAEGTELSAVQQAEAVAEVRSNAIERAMACIMRGV